MVEVTMTLPICVRSMDSTVSCDVALAFPLAQPPSQYMNVATVFKQLIAVFKCTKKLFFFLIELDWVWVTYFLGPLFGPFNLEILHAYF